MSKSVSRGSWPPKELPRLFARALSVARLGDHRSEPETGGLQPLQLLGR
jgi:hypothetical protein